MFRTIHDGDISASKLVFDELYKNDFEKEKLDKNDKFFYFKTLYRIKHKYMKQGNHDLYTDVFHPHFEGKMVAMPRQTMHVFQTPNRGNYNVQKINNRLFRISRGDIVSRGDSSSGTAGRTQRQLSLEKKFENRELRPQTQSLSFRMDQKQQLQRNVQARLENIVSQHRNQQRKYQLKKSGDMKSLRGKSLKFD